MANGRFLADAIYDSDNPPQSGWTIVDQLDMTRQKKIASDVAYEDLLVPVFRGRKRIYTPPSLEQIRERRRIQLESLHSGIKRFDNPHSYPVGLVRELYDQKISLIAEARKLERAQ